MNVKNEADSRGLILGLLYENGYGGVVVEPNNFAPPMDRHVIFNVGSYFHKDGIISDFPSDTGTGYFMQITLRGQAIWEGRQEATLDVAIPPQ